jgi:hypothetical protein
VAVVPDGTVWAGGEAGVSGAIGPTLQMAAIDRLTLAPSQLILSVLPEGAAGGIEHLVIDRLGCVHSLFIARTRDMVGVLSNGDVVRVPTQPTVFCQTVNAFAPTYPF